MTSAAKKTRVNAPEVLCGYIMAISTTAICLFFISLTHALIGRMEAGLFFPIRETLHVILTDIFTLPFFLIGVFVFAGLPSMLIIWVAYRFRFGAVVFFVLSGGAVALLCSVVASIISRNLIWFTDPPLQQPITTWTAIKNSMAYFAPCGILSGFVFWLRVGRFFVDVDDAY